MAAKKSLKSGSIFSQDLDRAIFIMYFLGAIMPLVALGITMHQFVFPALLEDESLTNAMLGLLLGISALTLIAFFALRRIARSAIGRMNSDNALLQGILSASKNLSTSFHVHDVAEIAAQCARNLTESNATLLFMRAAADKPLALVASSGKRRRNSSGSIRTSFTNSSKLVSRGGPQWISRPRRDRTVELPIQRSHSNPPMRFRCGWATASPGQSSS